jgi:hypothetical protein
MAAMMLAYSDSMPLGLLGLGMFFLFAALVGTGTGEAWARFGQSISRARNPKQFWLEVAIQYLAGAGLIGYFLYKFYGK